MLTLHFAPNSRASRTLWLLEELGLEYKLNRMDFHPKDLKSDEHRARHPLGRIPVLDDGDVSIYESGAIAEYILERHKNGGLKPASNDPHFPEYLQWFHYCEDGHAAGQHHRRAYHTAPARAPGRDSSRSGGAAIGQGLGTGGGCAGRARVSDRRLFGSRHYAGSCLHHVQASGDRDRRRVPQPRRLCGSPHGPTGLCEGVFCLILKSVRHGLPA